MANIFCQSNVYDLNYFRCKHLNAWAHRCEKYDIKLDVLFGQHKRVSVCSGVEADDDERVVKDDA